jgi:hypothetical protein
LAKKQREKHKKMKDYVLGSEEFLIEEKLTTCTPLSQVAITLSFSLQTQLPAGSSTHCSLSSDFSSIRSNLLHKVD